MFVLQSKIPLDMWFEIKSFIVHDIKTQGKHLKQNKDIICYNNVLKLLPRFYAPKFGPQIVFNSHLNSFRIAKYLYHIQAFKPRRRSNVHINDGKLTIITFCEMYPAQDDTCYHSSGYGFTGSGRYLYHKNDYNKYLSI